MEANQRINLAEEQARLADERAAEAEQQARLAQEQAAASAAVLTQQSAQVLYMGLEWMQPLYILPSQGSPLLLF